MEKTVTLSIDSETALDWIHRGSDSMKKAAIKAFGGHFTEEKYKNLERYAIEKGLKLKYINIPLGLENQYELLEKLNIIAYCLNEDWRKTKQNRGYMLLVADKVCTIVETYSLYIGAVYFKNKEVAEEALEMIKALGLIEGYSIKPNNLL